MTSDVQSVPAPREASNVLIALVQLAKPNITRMVLITTLCGALIAPGPIDVVRLVLALVGTGLVVAAANALNMYLERDVDALMERTKSRPLPSGRLTPELALGFGVVTAVSGLVMVSFLVHPLAGLLAAAALLSYVFLYTPLKRVSPWALHVGAIPGAIPPLIGWASMTGSLALEPWLLFALLFVWQIPHFLAIALFRQREYEAAGMAVYPAVKGVPATKRAMLGYSVLMVAVSLLPLAVAGAGLLYAAFAVPLGLAFTLYVARGFSSGDEQRWARRVFFASLPYLVLVFSAMVASVWI